MFLQTILNTVQKSPREQIYNFAIIPVSFPLTEAEKSHTPRYIFQNGGAVYFPPANHFTLLAIDVKLLQDHQNSSHHKA
jgi:hypothetical protein